jgi:peptide deformylase
MSRGFSMEARGMPILRQIAQLGQPVLRGVAGKVADPAAPAIQALIGDMLLTVADADGVGIAAPQVFEPLSLFIVASRPNQRYPDAPEMEPTVMINPEILWVSDELEKGWEGCLSIPGLRGPVPRHRRIGVRYLTRAGEVREEEYADFLARVFQHEFDHLQGMVFVDRVESTRELVTEKEYIRRLQRHA